MAKETITAREYLTKKGIKFWDLGNGELKIHCVYSNCDNDSKGNEAHLYITDDERGLHDCKKCGAKGNLIALAKHLDGNINQIQKKGDKKKTNNSKKEPDAKEPDVNIEELAEQCHKNLTPELWEYLKNERGLTEEVIKEFKLGCGEFYSKKWLTIPVFDGNGKALYFKLRRLPGDNTEPKYLNYPKGLNGHDSQLYNLRGSELANEVYITSGELDCLKTVSMKLPAVSSTSGEGTLKESWLKQIKNNEVKKVTLIPDTDSPGLKARDENLRKLLKFGFEEVSVIDLKFKDKGNKDLTDACVKEGMTKEEILALKKQVTEVEEQKIDISQFKPLSNQELLEILDLTIKEDKTNKLITFYAELLAYTDDAQINVSNVAPSCTGKSYNPTQIAQLFPEEDVLEIGYCSPTAFFHDSGKYDKTTNTITVDLSRKIIIFLDQPHTILLQHLRPLLSHDKKIISIKITDKSQKSGNRTKNIQLIGFPSVVFCTANLNIDEQESTRFIVLSPETSQEKIKAGIDTKLMKDSNKKAFIEWLNSDPRRNLLKERIKAIKQEGVEDIEISDRKKVSELFYRRVGKNKPLKPRHQRDIGKITSLIKAHALLNPWFRNRDDLTIIANDKDIEAGFNLWSEIAESQELSIPPYIYKVYQEIILSAYNEKGKGLERSEVLKKHFKVYGRPLQEKSLRLEIIPMLENAGLMYQEEDKNDKRKKLIYPTHQDTVTENNSVSSGGVGDLDSLFEPKKREEE